MSDLSQALGIATCRSSSGEVVVRLVGALDAAGADRLIDESTQIDPRPGDRVRLHLHDVTFVDSVGIGALCYTEAFVKARGGVFEISAPGARTRTVLELAGLGRYCSPDADTQPDVDVDVGVRHRLTHLPVRQ